MSTPACQVRVYSRQGCCLCDEVQEHLAALRNRYAFEVKTVDIASNPALEARYGEQIPVVHINEREIGWGRIPPALLEQHIALAVKRT